MLNFKLLLLCLSYRQRFDSPSPMKKLSIVKAVVILVRHLIMTSFEYDARVYYNQICDENLHPFSKFSN